MLRFLSVTVAAGHSHLPIENHGKAYPPRKKRGTRFEVSAVKYPGGALYQTEAWVSPHDKEWQALTVAIGQ